ncbi:MAG TPA: radical SAM protein [Chloroflexota bacterium]|nr:radical SAM protein [Chloroflexota bacterium]
MASVRYIDTQCKSALNRVRGMPFDWSLNPYRGCRHRCAYCYARVSHTFMGHNAGEDFDSVIYAKTNLAQVLQAELRRPNWTRAPIAIGTATDPYQPIEGRYRLTRSCLTVLAAANNPANIITKGTLVVRDSDLLQDLARRAGCGVSISLISLDEQLWRAFEPGTPPPAQRLAALQRLAAAGIPCGLALAPVLPKLTDSLPTLEAVVKAAADNGARWLWSGTLHFEPAVRDWFFTALQRHFPESLAAYERIFGAEEATGGLRYAPAAYGDALGQRVAEL